MTNPNMHTEGIEEGIVEDTQFETYYNQCTGISAAKGYIRVFQDGNGQDYETRIDNATLIQMGWTAPNDQT